MSKIKQLDWGVMSGHFGSSYIASPPIGDPYYIWLTDDGFKCATPSPNRRHAIHGSLSQAKEYCQTDFEQRIKGCIDIEFEQRFCKWLSDQDLQAIEKVGIETLQDIFKAMDEMENK